MIDSHKTTGKYFNLVRARWLPLLVGLGLTELFLSLIQNARTVTAPTRNLTTFAVITTVGATRLLLRTKRVLYEDGTGARYFVKHAKRIEWSLIGVALALWLPWIADKASVAPQFISRSLSAVTERLFPDTKITILVADFDGPEPQNYRVTQNIYDGLVKSTAAFPLIRIRLLRQSITFEQGPAVARSIGESQEGNILVWGSYGRTSQAVQVTVNIERLPRPYPLSIGRQISIPCGDAVRASLLEEASALDSYTLQLDLSHQLSALTMAITGEALYRSADYTAAINTLTQALADWNNPSSIVDIARVHYLRGEAYLSSNDLDRALIDFDTVIRVQPRNGSAYNNRGNIHSRKGDSERAIDDYTRSIDLGGACTACAYLNRGSVYADMGEYVKAISDFNETIRIKPTADAYDRRGHAYIHQQRFEEALKDINAAIALEPNVPCFANSRGEAFESQHEYDKALADYSRAIDLSPQESLFLKNRGQVYASKRDWHRAIADYTSAIAIKSNFVEAYRRRADAYLMNDSFSAAISDLSTAISIDDENPVLYVERGRAFAKSGDASSAIANYNQGGNAYYNRARSYELKNDPQRAIADYKEVLSITTPQSPVRQLAAERLRILGATGQLAPSGQK